MTHPFGRSRPARSLAEQGDLSDLTQGLLTTTAGRLASAPGAYLESANVHPAIQSIARDGVLLNPLHVADIGTGGNMQPRMSSAGADAQTRKDILDLTHALTMAAQQSLPFAQAVREAQATNRAVRGAGGIAGGALGTPPAGVGSAGPAVPGSRVGGAPLGGATPPAHADGAPVPGGVPVGRRGGSQTGAPPPTDNPIEQAQESRYSRPDLREYAGGTFYRDDNGQFHLRERVSFYEGREGSVGRLSRRLGTRLTHYTHGNIPDLVRDNETGKYHHVNPDGSAGEEASQAEVSQYERNSAITGRVRGIGQRIEEAGILRSLPLGNVGIAYGIANEAIGQVQRQRQINSQIRSITGDTSTSGIVNERIRSAGFRLSTLGTFSGEQASELYEGTLEAGFRGSNQNNALSLAVSQFRRNGVQVAEILQIMNTAAETGGKALNGVSEALDSVTKQAKATGQNAAELRKQFANTFQAIAENSGSGNPGTALLAAAETTASSGLGSQFSRVNLNNQQSTTNLYRQAIASGTPIGKFLAEQGANPQLGAAASNKLIASGVNAATSTEQRQFISQRLSALQQQYGNGNIPDNELSKIAEELQTEYGLNPITAQSIIGSVGGVSGLTNDNTAGYIVRYYAGLANPENAVSLQKSGSSPITVSQQDQIKNRHTGGGLLSLGSGRDVTDWEYKLEHGGLVPGLSNGTSSPNDSRAGGWTSGQETSPVYQYEKAAEKSGQRSPVIEKLLTMNGGARGIRQLLGSRFRVQTKDGEKDVSFNDAIKYYSDQLTTGNVELIGGDNGGKTVAQLTGLGTGEDLSKTDSARKDAQGKTYDPNSAEEKKKAGSTGGGTVTITPSPYLQQLFQFTPTGDVNIQYGASTGTAPDASAPTGTKLGG